MRAKIGNLLSEEQEVMGGAVQGSVLGVMDHNAVMEFVDEEVTDDVFKYVDDLTLQEAVERDAACLVDNSGTRPIHTFKPAKIQKNFEKLADACSNKGLKINGKKTQLLSISKRTV